MPFTQEISKVLRSIKEMSSVRIYRSVHFVITIYIHKFSINFVKFMLFRLNKDILLK